MSRRDHPKLFVRGPLESWPGAPALVPSVIMVIRRTRHTSSRLLGVLVAVLLGLSLGVLRPPVAFAQQKKQSVKALITKGQTMFDEVIQCLPRMSRRDGPIELREGTRVRGKLIID